MRFVLVHKVFQQTYFAKRQQGFIGSHARASAAAQDNECVVHKNFRHFY